MIVEQFEVCNELGLHARVASRIVRELSKFESNVIVKKEGKDFNLKSVLGVMTVNAKKGDVLTIEFSGSDEAAAVEAVRVLFLNKFGEK
ncbi:HPr family phosphocarrier protein [Neobacillus notoginsengisoli]|uniref:HPr family phosphocarrier protein n=1 Tax=Neobacillus notoginsengisoli TaxID=1578198 RepID=A0A417YID2_9BACI|nr:HPr family phosphocarrier protein [Neobacillus notoginsengisoli]RHW32815.1 HPr family phosphocarrier protein [Neobacillus notoginsengisoli]